MSYIDVYLSRINHLGSSVAEVAQNAGERSFFKWLNESPHTVSLSVERGIRFRGIILTNKDSENKKIMFLNVANDIPIFIGDIINWQDGNNLEKWIIFQKEKKANGTYQTFSIIRCNYFIKWIDKEGHLQGSWCYFTSSLDSKIKENYRTWNSLITPQPNKYAEILLPKLNIERKTHFIIEDEAWYVVESDFSSVPGIMYMSLTEEKVNEIYDNLIDDIAETDKLAKYDFIFPQEMQTFHIGDEINLSFYLLKNGEKVNLETSIVSKTLTVVNKDLIAVSNGVAQLEISLKFYPTIKQEISIIVDDNIEQYGYIIGNDFIKLDREAEYIFETNIDGYSATFSVSDESLAKISNCTNSSCTVHANDRNKLGELTLIAIVNGQSYTKVIKIIPLW